MRYWIFNTPQEDAAAAGLRPKRLAVGAVAAVAALGLAAPAQGMHARHRHLGHHPRMHARQAQVTPRMHARQDA